MFEYEEYKKPQIKRPITKLLIPNIPMNYLRRFSLSGRYKEAFKRKIILITAPAGYGKTTFMTEALINIAHPIIWISLDKRDNSILEFWNNIIMALQKVNPFLGQGALTILQNNDQSIELVVTDLINEIIETIPDLCIVLDDYHCIESQNIHDSINFLINYLPPEAHLIISSRTYPPLSLSRLRGQDNVADIKTSDLRFTVEETAKFLNNVMNLSFTKAQIQEVYKQIEGWIAGLQMLVISLKETRNKFKTPLASFDGSNQDIMEYLTREVLEHQEEYISKFLLKTGIFNWFNAAMCNYIFERDDSQKILDYLSAKNLFLHSYESESKYFHYHSLFKDVLYKQLIDSEPLDTLSLLYSRGSNWFEQQGLIEEAIEFALNANEYGRALDLLSKNASLMIGQDVHRDLLKWVSRLPHNLTSNSLWANIACAVACDATRQQELEEQYAKVAFSLIDSMPNLTPSIDLDAHALGSIAFLKAMLSYNKGDIVQTVKYAEEGLASMPEAEIKSRCGLNFAKTFAYWRQGQLIDSFNSCGEALRRVKLVAWPYSATLGMSMAAHVRFALGHLNSAISTCREAIQIGTLKDGKEISSSSFSHLLLAQIFYQRNLLDEAEEQVLRAIRLSENGQEPVLWLNCQMALARIYISRGENDYGMEYAHQSKMIFEKTLPNNLQADLFMTRLWLMLGDDSTAADYSASWTRPLLSQADGLPKDEAFVRLIYTGLYNNDIRNIWTEIPLLTHIRVNIAQGKIEGLIELLECIRQEAENRQWKNILIETIILEALVFNAQGNSKASLKLLKDVLTLAKKESYIRVFIDEGLPMYILLKSAIGRGIYPEYLSKIIAAFNAAHPLGNNVSESLTKREIEILELICGGVSNQDIAGQLYIGLSTVKNHIHNIYGKLDVDNRTQAVIRAKELGLLSS